MPSINIKQAVLKRDIFAIRSYLLSDILIDKNLTQIFKEDFEYCLQNGISEDEIYENHDGKEILLEVSSQNYAKIRDELSVNFSKERLSALKEIAIKLYPKENPKVIKQPTKNRNNVLYVVVAGVVIVGVIGLILLKNRL